MGTGGGETPVCEPLEGKDLRGEAIRLMMGHLLNGGPLAAGGPTEGSTRGGG